MTVFSQRLNQFRADEAGSPDDDDSHDEPSIFVLTGRQCQFPGRQNGGTATNSSTAEVAANC
jgi:hypothetical protein